MASKASGRARTAGGRRGRRKDESAGGLPDVYQDMLNEAATSSPSHFGGEGQPVKKRKIGGRTTLLPGSADKVPNNPSSLDVSPNITSDDDTFRPQTAYDSGSSDESDIDWEEVTVDGQKGAGTAPVSSDESPSGLDLVLEPDGRDNGEQRIRARNVTSVERKLRVEIHKMHILCLLAHVHIRNAWLEDPEVLFQRSRSFMDGLEQASDVWKVRFKINARGLRRALWARDEAALKDFKLPADMDPPMDRADFRQLAGRLEGSRDVGAQLFCALMRAAGVEARLVCSFQPLPLSATTHKEATPKKVTADFVVDHPEYKSSGEEEDARDVSHLASDSGATGPKAESEATPLVPRYARRLGQPSLSDRPQSNPEPVKTTAPPRKRIRESAYPVYWVEAFNEALQKWIPVDPLVTKTIAKPSKFEPPMTDAENSMSYVVAFEEDGVAYDVTRRYAKAFNAKTRKERIEATKGGDKWWRKALRIYSRGWDLDRDQVENAELASREAQEPMPRNVQDFKDHPYYALERHLRRNEVIFPKSEIGKVATGKSAMSGAKTLEPIYRRKYVKEVKSAESWYRVGREIEPGQQPLKRVRARRKAQRQGDDEAMDTDDEEATEGTGLYAEYQTLVYEAPPVVYGRVPRNAYGNLDIHVPSMVPKGGVHIPYPEASQAARLIGVDAVAAVTGFTFKGRHGTAVISGVIAASEYAEAIKAVVSALRDDAADEAAAKKSVESLRLWRRFMAALRIRERIDGYEIEGETRGRRGRDQDDTEMAELSADEGGGGFFPDRGMDDGGAVEPTAARFRRRILADEEGDDEDDEAEGEDMEAGGFLVDEDAEEAMDEMESYHHMAPISHPAIPSWDGAADAVNTNSMPPSYDDTGGGGGGGGFIPDETTILSTEALGGLKAADIDLGGGGFVLDDEAGDEIPPSEILGEGHLSATFDEEPVQHQADPQTKSPISYQDANNEKATIADDASPTITSAVIEPRTIFPTDNPLHPLSEPIMSGGLIPPSAPPPSTTSLIDLDAHIQSQPHDDPHPPSQSLPASPREAITPPTIPPPLTEPTINPLSTTSSRSRSRSRSESSPTNSLISHDPDDDDAEVEWLVSD
ncbi:MAG: hypothetical protein M1817_000453 [Caeruleum heppii]|nr:MAG: hypothetical protein M1817_000453 [Caeruleum heppii]